MLDRFGARGAAIGCILLQAACSGGSDGPTDTTPALTVKPGSVSVTAATTDDAPQTSVLATLSAAPDRTIYALVHHDGTVIDYAGAEVLSDRSGRIDLVFKNPEVPGPGVHHGELVLQVCYDEACASHVRGSPRRIAVTYTVTGAPAPEPEPPLAEASPPPDGGLLSAVATETLPYAVVDAEYSKALDAIVMVSWSDLNVRYVATGEEYLVPLPAVPTAVSVSPDGLTAFVGHSGAVTEIDLTLVGDPLLTPRHVAVDAPIGDLVAAGHGWVHAFPSEDQWVSIYSIHPASNTVVAGFGVYEDMAARLNPRGTSLYGATNGLSPHDIHRFRARDGRLTSVRESPYHGHYEMCGDLWFSAEGHRIYTACGNVFRSSDYASQDMTYLGTLGSASVAFYGARIVGLDDSPAAGVFALVEGPSFPQDCGVYYSCDSRLTFYARDSAEPLVSYEIQDSLLGEHVFFRSDGTQVFVLARQYGNGVYQLLTY